MTNRTKQFASLLIVSLLSVLAASCGSSDSAGTTPTATTLNATQTKAVAAAVTNGVGSAIGQQSRRELREARGTVTHMGATSVTCSGGGTMSVSGDMTFSSSTVGETTTITANPISFTVVATACKTTSDGSTYTFTTTGLTYTGSMDLTVTVAGQTVTTTGNDTSTLDGTVSVTGTNLNASCAINISETLTFDTTKNPEYTGSATGTVCGSTVSATF